MGLDQFAYIEDGIKYNDKSRQEIAYWTKHPNLQGWMERLWSEKMGYSDSDPDEQRIDFNGEELELTWEDIDRLEKDIKAGYMSSLDTVGFFFGNASDDRYREQDLKFCNDAKSEIFLCRRVFYNSSW